VTVLTGFLGAGKTTLLRRFLETPEGAGTAIIVNEFGAEAIDDTLLRGSAEETALLGNGCLCCVTRSDLQNALRRLVAERQRGAIPDFRRIVIETSGLADPSPILQTFSTDRALAGEFHVEVVVAVVDAAAGKATLDWSAEARKQVIFADVLAISKTDIAGSDATKALTAQLAALNPRAAVEIAVNGQLNPRRFTEAALSAPGHFVAEAIHSDGIVSFVLRDDTPVSWPSFARAMETLAALRGPDLLRAKGLLNVEGCRGPVVVQFVQHLAHAPVELAAWPDDDRRSRVVFITRGISERQVRDLFAAVKALGRSA
jgi:G3E family GTPase